jgi:hypothetical protein
MGDTTLNKKGDETTSKKEYDWFKTRLDLMFSKYIDHEPSDDIETIRDYFDFINQNIDYNTGKIDVDQSLIGQFESICLILQDRLLLYPDSLRAKVLEIIKDDELTQFFGLLSTLNESERRSLRSTSTFHLVDKLLSRFFGFDRHSKTLFFHRLGKEHLLDIKVSLNRISQILKYASTIELLDYDTGQSEFKDHYDPDLVDKPKVIALINILRMQIKDIPDQNIRNRINERVDQLEKEIQKRKPRWGRIIAGFFILFSFIADMKTLAPNIYDELYKTVNNIVMILHEEGQTHKDRKNIFYPQEERVAMLPTRIEILNPEEEDQDGKSQK